MIVIRNPPNRIYRRAMLIMLLVSLVPVPSRATELKSSVETPRAESTSGWKADRKLAAHRRRRIIMNNDGNDVRGLPEDVPQTRETFLGQRTSPLAGSHVDTICYCTGGTFNMYRHHSQETEPYRKSGNELDWGWQLGLDGPDVLKTIVDFGHRQGIEIFWSMRMNDSHDSKYAWCMSQWKKDHPDFLMGRPGEEFPFGRARWKGRWSALDYGEPEVRDKAFRILQDVATRYDVDGLELDFRHPVFFRPQMTGEPVTQVHCDMMTE